MSIPELLWIAQRDGKEFRKIQVLIAISSRMDTPDLSNGAKTTGDISVRHKFLFDY
jgi:hypothetical protein